MLPFSHHQIHVCVVTSWSPSLLLPLAFHLCMWLVRVLVLNLSLLNLVQIGVPAVACPRACYSHLYQPASRVQQVWWRAPKTCRGFSPLASTTTQSHRCGHGQESEEEAWYILLLWAAWLDLWWWSRFSLSSVRMGTQRESSRLIVVTCRAFFGETGTSNWNR